MWCNCEVILHGDNWIVRSCNFQLKNYFFNYGDKIFRHVHITKVSKTIIQSSILWLINDLWYLDYLPTKWLNPALCISWDRPTNLRFLDLSKISHFQHIYILPSNPAFPTYLSCLMAFRTCPTFSPTVLSASYSVFEKSLLPHRQFWRFFIYGSETHIWTSLFRFRTLIWNIKMPNRCLVIGGQYSTALVDQLSAVMDNATSVTRVLAIFVFFGSFDANTRSFPTFVCGARSPWLKRIFQRELHPATPSCSQHWALGINVPIWSELSDSLFRRYATLAIYRMLRTERRYQVGVPPRDTCDSTQQPIWKN